MKKVHFLPMLLAAAALSTACQKTLENEGTTPYEGNKGYVNISLNLPTTSGGNTRANDIFNAGTEAEYKVYSTIIALFYGPNEAEATCRIAFKLEDKDLSEVSHNGNVTTTYGSGAWMVPAPEAGENVYALAVLNAPSGLFSVTGTASASAVVTSTLNFKGNAFTGTVSELTTTSQDYSADIVSTTTGFLMTNAPIATGDHINVTVQTLQKINVYATEDEANADGAADKIYVERASAKVSMEVDVHNSYTVDTPNVPSYDKATVTVTGWTLQRTNKTYYAVRNASNWASWDDADMRFFSGRNDPIRVYWAEDPNYPSEAPADFNVIATASDVDEWNSVEDGNAAYCAENTAPAVNMTKGQLTSSIIRATFQPEGFDEGADFFMMGGTSAIMGIDDFKTWVKDILGAEEVTVSNTVTAGGSYTNSSVANLMSLVSVRMNGESAVDALTEDEADKLLAAANGVIKYYKGGVCYYNVYIRHFDDEQTPLPNDFTNANDYDASTLGRWGVVRNNWYELTVNSVSGPGEPDIPEVDDDDPADEQNQYINCDINILSWAVREQVIDL